jgi:hypothetical protein
MSSDPTTWGVKTNGFVCPNQAEVLESIENNQRAYVASDFDIAANSPNGQNNGIFSRQCALLWDGLRALNAAFSREGAEGDLLLQHGKLTGTTQEGPRSTVVTIANDLAAGTVLQAGIDFVSPLNRPEVLFTPIADYTAASTGTFNVAFRSVETGAVTFTTGSLTVIATPKTGWTACLDQSSPAPVIGDDGDSESEFRIRQETDLTRAGAGTAAALEADLVYDAALGTGVPGVLAAKVLENYTDNYDANGLPPHSIEPVIYADGTMAPSTLAEAIWLGRSATAQTYGQLSASYTDDDGETRTVKYSVNTPVPIYITYTVTKLPDYVGDDALKAYVVAQLAARYGAGDTVDYLFVAGLPFDLVGARVTDCRIGIAVTPTGTASIAMGSVREIPTFDAARIVC